MLEINNLKKTFENGSPALKGVDLKINKGEFVSILGRSGSGKTTLLRSINGLETASGGEIYLDNKQINLETINEAHQKKNGQLRQEIQDKDKLIKELEEQIKNPTKKMREQGQL